MTALNIWTTEHAACLLTDQAWMQGDRLAMIGAKVIVQPHLSLAVALLGDVTFNSRILIRDWLAAKPDQIAAMQEIMTLLAMVRDDVAKESRAETKPPKLFIALHHCVSGNLKIYVAYQKLMGLNHCFAPPSTVPLPNDLNKQGLIARIEDQRRQRNDIGGGIDLTLVTAAGITSETIHRWSDRLGEPITP